MLKTRMGTTIEFIRLDKWVIKMVVSIPHTKGLKVVASPMFTIDDLRAELALLEQAEPQLETGQCPHGVKFNIPCRECAELYEESLGPRPE